MHYTLIGLAPNMKALPGDQPTIADIELPLVVDYSDNVLLWVTLSLILVLGVMLVGWRLWRSRRCQAYVKIHKLKRLFATRQINSYVAVYEIANLLRMRFAQSRLSVTMPLPAKLESQRQRWRVFIASLDTARYAPPSQVPIAMDKILAESKYWLALWR